MFLSGRLAALLCILTLGLLSKALGLSFAAFSELLNFFFFFFEMNRNFFAAVSGCVSAESIITTVGTDVTLTCKYDIWRYGKLPVCWGRGAIPNRGCSNVVIKSDGTSVTSRLSERYLLQGDLGEGDVSLTIRQVEEEDSGMYGCRVEIPGLFNDHKRHITLSVVAGNKHFVLGFLFFFFCCCEAAPLLMLGLADGVWNQLTFVGE